MTGFLTLLEKEVMRFWKVMVQTLLAPILSAMLFQMVFFQTLSGKIVTGYNIDYSAFLIPGLVMMSALQNAYANSASSLIQSRLNGSIVFILLAPFSTTTFFSAYLIAAVLRGFLVGLGVLAAIAWFGLPWPAHIGLGILFCTLGCVMLGSLGIITGIVAQSFDRFSAFQNFIISPLAFLSGTFYSIHTLTPFWKTITYMNPIFYLVDGFRYSFLGHADTTLACSLAIALTGAFLVSAAAFYMIHTGYRLRS